MSRPNFGPHHNPNAPLPPQLGASPTLLDAYAAMPKQSTSSGSSVRLSPVEESLIQDLGSGLGVIARDMFDPEKWYVPVLNENLRGMIERRTADSLWEGHPQRLSWKLNTSSSPLSSSHEYEQARATSRK